MTQSVSAQFIRVSAVIEGVLTIVNGQITRRTRIVDCQNSGSHHLMNSGLDYCCKYKVRFEKKLAC